MLLLGVAAILSLIFFVIILSNDHKKHEKLNLPPGPKGLPFIGNLHQYDPLAPHLCLSKLAMIYGLILSMRFGRRSVVVIQSATMAKVVLKTLDHNFCSRPAMVAQQRLSYNGLDMTFVPYNEYFREIRKICVVHLFSSKRVQSFYPIRREEVSRMIQMISSLATDSKVVNLSDLLMAASSSIICRVAFGKRYEKEGAERSRFHRHLNETQAMLIAFFFTDYFGPVIGGCLDKLMGLSAKLERVFKDMDDFNNQIINDHLHPSRPKSEHEDIIGVQGYG